MRSATRRPRVSRPTRRSPVTSCSRRCTRPVPRPRRSGSSTWASSRTSWPPRSRASPPNASPASSATACAAPVEDLDIAQLRRLGATDEMLAEGSTFVSAVGCSELPADRLPGPGADLRDHARDRRHHPPHRRTRTERRHRTRSRSSRAWTRCAPRPCAACSAATSASKRWHASFPRTTSLSLDQTVKRTRQKAPDDQAVDAERRAGSASRSSARGTSSRGTPRSPATTAPTIAWPRMPSPRCPVRSGIL